MSTVKTYNPKTGKWEVRGTSQANSLGVIDVSGNFESDNVEGCLRELSEKDNEQEATIQAAYSAATISKSLVDELKTDFTDHVTNHPGGGSGSDVKLTSTFTGGVIDAEKELVIPIFFSSTNRGNGTLFISVNGIEIDMKMIEQGSSKISIPTLQKIESEIEMYVKDSKGQMSLPLYWKVIKGGIDLKINFDFNQDYSVSDRILIRYTIDTPIEDELTLELTYNGVKKTYPIAKGAGQKEFNGRDLGVGIHNAIIRVVSGDFKSQTFNVNLIIVSSYELYLSSSFKGKEFEYGSAVIIPYRISKMSSEFFEVKRIINDKVTTLSNQAGSYSWTIPSNELPIGVHTIRIEVRGTSNDYAFLEFPVTIIAGEYKPIEVEKTGLIAWFDANDMSNEDTNRELWKDRTSNNVVAKLKNFNFATNGWMEEKNENNEVVDRMLTCDNAAYVEIDLAPFEENAIYGLTIELLYKSHNIGYEDARILDCTDIVGYNEDGSPLYKGAYIDITSAVMRSDSQLAKVTLDEDTEVRITYVLDRFNKFCKLYIDGVLCRAFYLKDAINGPNREYENFQHANKIYLNGEKGITKSGACDIKSLRVYDMALDSEQILKNHLADIRDLKKQKDKYDINFNPKVSKTPVITFFGSKATFDAMSGEQPMTVRVKYDSPNPDFFGESFDYKNCDVKWQGSSSLEYIIKNYTIYLKDENFTSVKYTPFKNGIPENIFCLKADYIESSHANNLGLAKFVHECLYQEPTPAQLINQNYRTTVDGFPILLYIDYMDGKDRRLIGVFNLNLDRYSTYSYGYEDDNLKNKTLAYEISANSDFTAGAFVEWTPETGKNEIAYYADSYKLIYPPSRKGNDNYEEIKSLVRWVSSASDEVFKEFISRHFNVQYLMRYYLFVMIIGAVDSLGKNMKLVCYNADQPEQIWWPQFYDMDTVLGLNNTGNLIWDSDIEVQEGVFNTTGSVLWTKLRRVFQSELREEYSNMRKDRFTVANLMKYLYTEQINKIPEHNYNLDAQTKYLDFGPDYLNVCHGNRYHHMKKWIKERLVYVDSLMGYTGELSDTITMRINKPGNVSVWLETYIPMYLTVKWKDLPDEIINGQVVNRGKTTVRVGRNQKIEFKGYVDTATDQNVFIYAGRYLKSIDGLSELKVSELLFAKATKLTKLECHSDKLINTQVSSMANLQYLDLSGCTIYGNDLIVEGGQKLLDLTACRYLKRVDISDTALTALSFNINGGSIEEIVYPTAVQSVVLSNQPKLKKIGIPYGYKSILRSSEPLMGFKYDYILTPEEIASNPKAKPTLNKPTITSSKNHLTFKDAISVVYGKNYKIKVAKVGGNVIVYEFNAIGEKLFTKNISLSSNNIVDYTPSENINRVVVVLDSNGIWTQADMEDCRFSLAENIATFDESTALQTFKLNNCKNVESLSQYKYPISTSTFQSLKYVQELSLVNSLKLTEINFNGFSKLRNLELSGLSELLKIGFNDMNNAGETTMLSGIVVSNCPKVEKIEMNVSEPGKAITFSGGAVVDVGSLYTLKSIESNTPIIGLKTIIVNRDINDIILGKQYAQSWDSDIVNIWSYETATENEKSKYEGLDFKNITVKNIDLSGAKKIINSKNLNIAPINKFIINQVRDNNVYPCMTFNGTIDLSNYTESLVSLFKNSNISNLNLICNKNLTQTDYTSMFEGSTLGNLDIRNIMSRVYARCNLTKMFKNSDVKQVVFPPELYEANMTSMYENCLKVLSDINLLNNDEILNVDSMFKKCVNMTHIKSNWDKSFSNKFSHIDCYAECSGVTHINDEALSQNENPLNIIPRSWGGYGLNDDYTCIYKIVVPNSNYSFRFFSSECLIDNQVVDWGDGSITVGKYSHVYTTPGTYTIAGKIQLLNGVLKPSQGMIDCCTEVVKYSINANLKGAFYNFNKIKTINISNWNKNNTLTGDNASLECTFSNSGGDAKNTLTSIVGMDTMNLTNTSNINFIFEGLLSITNDNFKKFPIQAVMQNTSAIGMFKNCSTLITPPILIINDKISNISNFFTGCTSLINISGMVFGTGITTATSWYPPNLQTANNITIKNNFVSFKNCSTLINANDFIFDSNSADDLFMNCTSLINLNNLNLTNKIRTMGGVSFGSGTFSGCSSLATIDFANCDLSKLTRINYTFIGCTSLENIYNLNIASSVITSESIFPTSGKALTVHNLTLGSNTAKLNDYSNVCEFRNINILPNVTNLSSKFEGMINLKIDIDIPLHATNVTNMFKGCVNLTSVRSNWKKNYTLAISATDCYVGCTGITTIDGVNALAYQGDNGLDYLPILWGGKGFDITNTSVYKFIIPTNNYTLQFSEYKNDNTSCTNDPKNTETNWGDGAYTNYSNNPNCNHVYANAGTYIVKTKLRFAYQGTWQHSSVQNCLLEILKLSSTPLDYQYSFSGCSKLTKVNLDNVNITNGYWMFRNSNISQITGIPKFVGSAISIEGMFSGLPITSIDVSNWDMINIKNISSLFEGCVNLLSLDLKTWNTINVSNIDFMLRGTKLKSFTFYNFQSVVSASYVIKDSLITQITIGSGCNRKSTKIILKNCPWNININYVGVNTKINTFDKFGNETYNITDSLESSSRSFELQGQTYQNLIIGQQELNVKEEWNMVVDRGYGNKLIPTDNTADLTEVKGQTYHNLLTNTSAEKVLVDVTSKVVNDLEPSFNGGFDIFIDEIKGNTGQDKITASSIASIGVFQSDGSYKIEVECNNGVNLLSEKMITNPGDRYARYKVKLKKNTKYSIVYRNADGSTTSSGSIDVYYYDYADKEIGTHDFLGYNYFSKFTTKNIEFSYVVLTIDTWMNNIKSYMVEGDVDLNETYIDFINSKQLVSNKTSIALPQPLRKIGDVYDRLYWDNAKGYYCIEKRIDVIRNVVAKISLEYGNTPNDSWYWSYWNAANKIGQICHFVEVDTDFTNISSPTFMSNKFVYIKDLADEIKPLNWIYKGPYSNCLAMSFDKSVDLNSWCNNNMFDLYAINNNSTIIDLPQYNKKIFLTTYANSFVVVSNCNVNATSIKVSTDAWKKDIKLLPSTKYTLALDCDRYTGSDNISYNLGGTTGTILTTNGYKYSTVSITTPSTLINKQLLLSGLNNKVKNVMLLREDTLGIVSSFEGVKSFGEYDENTGKYLVEVLSTNKNLWDWNSCKQGYITSSNIVVGEDVPFVQANDNYKLTFWQKVNPNSQYYLWLTSAYIQDIYNILYLTADKKVIAKYDIDYTTNCYISTQSNCNYICYTIRQHSPVKTLDELKAENKAQIELGSSRTDLIAPKNSLKSFLLDEPLRKVDTVVDRLYFDNLKNKYCVERNTKEFLLDGSYDWEYQSQYTFNNNTKLKMYFTTQSFINTKSVSPYGITSSKLSLNYFHDWGSISENSLLLPVTNNRFAVAYDGTAAELKTYFNNNPTKIVVPIENKIIQETGYMDKVINTYYPTMYVSTNSTIKASSLKIESIPQTIYKANIKEYSKYAIILDVDRYNLSNNLTFNAAGITGSISTSSGYKNKVQMISTGGQLANRTLKLTGEGNRVKNVMIIPIQNSATKVESIKYFDGVKSLGEYDSNSGKYKVVIRTKSPGILILDSTCEKIPKANFDSNGNVVQSEYTDLYYEYTEVEANTKYTIEGGFNIGHQVAFYDVNKTFISFFDYTLDDSFTTPSNAKYIRVVFAINRTFKIYKYGTVVPSDYVIESSAKTFLLPQQLLRINDIADRLYWDSTKGFYCIEKNIGTIDKNLLLNNYVYVSAIDNRSYIDPIWTVVDTTPVGNRETFITQTGNIFKGAADYGNSGLYLSHDKNELLSSGYVETDNSLKLAISNNISYINFVYSTPKIIELPQYNSDLGLLRMWQDLTILNTPNEIKPSKIKFNTMDLM